VLWFCLVPVLFFFHTGTPAWMVFLLAALMGIGISGTNFTPWAMLPDVLDVDLMVTGRQRQGVYSGVMTFLRKISSALAIFIVGWVLELSGYIKPLVEGEIVIQPDSFILAVRCLVVILPLILIFLGVIIARRYPLNPDRYAQVQEEISRQIAAGTPGLTAGGEELARTLFGNVQETASKIAETR
jgi:Na+/melibiose symporter-like transporter